MIVSQCNSGAWLLKVQVAIDRQIQKKVRQIDTISYQDPKDDCVSMQLWRLKVQVEIDRQILSIDTKKSKIDRYYYDKILYKDPKDDCVSMQLWRLAAESTGRIKQIVHF